MSYSTHAILLSSGCCQSFTVNIQSDIWDLVKYRSKESIHQIFLIKTRLYEMGQKEHQTH